MARTGRQAPTFERVGAWAKSDGDEAVDVFSSYGFGFDEAQAHQMRLYLAKNAAGEPACIQIASSVPRQNGKSYAARWYAVWCAAVCGQEVVYSAHNGDTVDEFFRMLCDVFEDASTYPDFAAMLKGSPYKQPGRQVLRFKSGGRIRFSTRTNSKIRGGTVSAIVIDEAQELTDAQLNALLPSSSASPGGPPQVVMVGTPPDPTCPGTVFRRLHDAAHGRAECGDSWWLEWAAEDMPPEGATPQEALSMAYETNPALGARISERAVLNEYASMTRDGFARERLGWWSPAGSFEHAIDAEGWDACTVPDDAAPQGGSPAFGVKFSADGKSVALSAAVAEREGPCHVELVEFAPTAGGTAWLRGFLLDVADRCAAVAVDGRSGASALCSSLLEGGFPRRALTECSMREAIAAASMLCEAVESRTLTHIDSPALDESAKGSVRRRIGSNGGFGFGDGPASASAPVESAALALLAARTSRRDPSRKQVIW